MKTRRQQLLLAYEWLIAIAGVLLGVAYHQPLARPDVEVLLYLLVVGVVLESMPVPVGKALTSLMPVVPISVLVTHGTESAIWLTIAVEAIAMAIRPTSAKLSVKAFNVGQYTISVFGMAVVYHGIAGTAASANLNWTVFFALLVAIGAFIVVNHTLVHLHGVIRQLFAWQDLYNLLIEGLNYLLSLPIIILMIALTPSQPLFAMLSILPILVLGQGLRMYRKIMFLQSVQSTAVRLVSEFDSARIAMEVASTAAKLSFADLTVVTLLSEDRERLVPRAVFPVEKGGEVNQGGVHSTQGGVVWDVLGKDTNCEYVPDARRDRRAISDGSDSPFYRSMAVYPIRLHGTAHGAIVCYAHRPHAFSQMTEYIENLATQLGVLLENAKLYQQLQEQSRRDAATGLHNYRYFYEELSRRMETAKSQKRPLSVAIIDIDNFKKLNDTYGHLAGDAVLKSLAELFLSAVDTTTLVARYGGEEFVMVWDEDVDTTYTRIERIRKLVTRHVVTHNQYRLRGITVSAGIAGFPQDSADDRDLLLKADSALYWGAKQRGRNRSALYAPEFDAELFVDKLTGLYTMHFATIRLREELRQGRTDWSAICLDVEHMGNINATFGFHAGDEVLKQVSTVIKEHIRQSELACRYGNDEFLILLNNVSQPELKAVTKRLTKAIASHRFEYNKTVMLSVRCKYTYISVTDVRDATVLFDRVSHSFLQLQGHTGESSM